LNPQLHLRFKQIANVLYGVSAAHLEVKDKSLPPDILLFDIATKYNLYLMNDSGESFSSPVRGALR